MSSASSKSEVELRTEPSTETGIVHSITSPLSFLKWIKNLVIHPAIFSAYAEKEDVIDTPPPVDPDHIFAGSFIKTYPVDGYVPSTTDITVANGQERSLLNQPVSADRNGLPVLFALLVFLGVPARVTSNMDGRQFVRNFFGNWDSLWPASTQGRFTLSGKRFWNIVFSPAKLVIFLFKVVGLFFKLPLNILKLATEFLPELLVNYTGKEIGEVFRTLKDSRQKASIKSYHYWPNIGVHAAGIIWLIILFPVHYVARLVGFVGEALTSPEKSARDAWEFGARVRPRALGYVLGTLGAAFSLALTTVLWMITLPFVVTGILTLIPQLIPVLASIAQWPVIASSLSFIQGTFSLVVGSLPAAFGAIATAMSAALGLSVSSLVVAVTVTAAVIAAPVLTIGSRIADELSNGWARWKADMGFADGMKAIFVPSKTAKDQGAYTELKDVPSADASKMVDESEASVDMSESHLHKMEESKDYMVTRFKKLEKGYKRLEVDTRPYAAI